MKIEKQKNLKEFKKLKLSEDAMLISRIMRAPERRVWKIDIGNIPPEEIDNHMNDLRDKMKKTPYIDRATGEYDLNFNMMNMLEDIYLPYRGGEGGSSVDTLPGLTNEGQIDDVNYYRRKMMSALKIPQAFLGYSEGVEGKNTLANEDVRFARTIERIQQVAINELKKMAIIHLTAQGFQNSELIEFDLSLNTPSIIYEQQRVNVLNDKTTLAQSMREMHIMSDHWIATQLYGLTDEEYDEQKEKVIEDYKWQFRLSQIENEGNDPEVTGESFGTPHDIVSMQTGAISKKQDQFKLKKDDKRADNPGRPKRGSDFGTHDSAFGRDPIGAKDSDKLHNRADDVRKREKAVRNTRVSNETLNAANTFLDRKKASRIISETFHKSPTEDLLDESQLIDDSKED